MSNLLKTMKLECKDYEVVTNMPASTVDEALSVLLVHSAKLFGGLVMKIFHIDRDYNKTLEQQKKELKSQYLDFKYLWTDGAHGDAKIHFMAEGKKEDK